jgi:hypothetical protein
MSFAAAQPLSLPAAARKPLVRPWALGGPILILLLCLPMLQPLRFPADVLRSPEQRQLLSMVRENAAGRWQVSPSPPVSVRALVEPSPTFALLLAGPARLMQSFGLKWDEQATLMAYLLTAVGVTLPAALTAGLVYRMARLFELSRPHRAALGLLCVSASGLIAYATSLNPHALSAALVIGAAAAMLHALRAPRARQGVGWAAPAGLSAALAASLDIAALPVAVIAPLVFVAWRVKWSARLLAVALYVAGALPPMALHRALHAGDLTAPLAELRAQPPIFRPDATSDELESGWSPWLAYHGERMAVSTVGDHGAFSHFPLLLLGGVGTIMLMHRHWPEAVKWLAAATIGATGLAVIAVALSRQDLADAGYATRWFIAVSPLLLFWSGAWLRKPHGGVVWTGVAVAAMVSVTAGMIGAARPTPPDGYAPGFTAASALDQLMHPPQPPATVVNVR